MSIYMHLVCFDMVDIVLLCKKLLYRKKKNNCFTGYIFSISLMTLLLLLGDVRP